MTVTITNRNPYKLISWFLRWSVLGMIALLFTSTAVTQPAVYEHQWRPSFWFNTNDGIQTGVRYFFYRDHPDSDRYRVQAGLWLNTRIPENPIAYSIDFDHPITQFRSWQEPLTLGLESRFREGLHRHGGYLEKRRQTGPLDDQFITVRMHARYVHHVDRSYLVFPETWSGQPHTVLSATGYFRHAGMSRFITGWAGITGTSISDDIQTEAGLSWYQPLNRLFTIGIKAGSRLHSATDGLPQWSSNLTFQQAALWHDNPWFRSHGSLPVTPLRNGQLVNSGVFPSLRGYARHDIRRFQTSDHNSIRAIHALSADLEIANPLDLYLQTIPIAGVFAHVKTRLFADAAIVRFRDTAVLTTSDFIANAGAGVLLHFNLPDQFGLQRGFTIRWDLPFWVSDPLDKESGITFRQQLSFDIIIPF